ncbi:hypothetical protein TNCV_1708351 [Trichonephila clavipes]|nr:hypothetical protein TNCV_1708351 [Trichonephila clavipes]
MDPGGKLWSTTTSRKVWSNHVRIATGREERRIHHMAGEHLNASTAEIFVFFRHQSETMTCNKSIAGPSLAVLAPRTKMENAAPSPKQKIIIEKDNLFT